MKHIALGFILSLLLRSVAWGQSACPPGYESLCRPPAPSPTPRPSPSPNGRQQQSDEDNLTTEDLANQKIDPAVQFKQAYAESHSYSDFIRAKNLLDEALTIKPNDGRALMIMVELYGESNDHESTWQYAVKARDQAEFNSGYRRHYLHAWFTVRAAEEYVAYLDGYIDAHCTVHTEATGSGGTVDPSVNVAASIAQCQNAENMRTAAIKDRDKEQAKFHKKYDNHRERD